MMVNNQSYQVNGKSVWPKDPHSAWAKLRLSNEQMKHLQEIIDGTYPKLRASQRTFKKGQYHFEQLKSWLPRSIAFLSWGEVIVSLKDVPLIGKGGERKVKSVYGAISGSMLAKKRVWPNTIEIMILEHFFQKPSRGIVKVVGFYTNPDLKKGGIKSNVIQTRYDSDLESFIRTQSLPLHIKIDMIKQLLEGMASLHDYLLAMSPKNASPSHNDISTMNTLIGRGADGKLRAVIDDFGQSGKRGVPDGKDWYFSPELCQLKKELAEGKQVTSEQLSDFNRKTGQARDIWALALVIADIMKSGHGRSRGECVGLTCVSDLVKQGAQGIHALPTRLSQEMIDREIKSYKIPNNTEEAKKANQIWKVIGSMMQTNYTMRPTAKEALKQIH